LHGSPALSDLAVNPLLLTMIATVHRYRSSLPGRRVELYAEICEVSLGKRQQSKGIELDLTPAQKQRVLEPLAWEMMAARKREISAEDACAAIKRTLSRVKQGLQLKAFLTSVENDSSLLLEKEAGGVYAFAHLTFQEFLAACHAQNDQSRIDLLTTNVGDGWWGECIRLFAATGDATPILRACIVRRPLDPEALALALHCVEEAERKEPQIEEELKRIVDAGLDDADSANRNPIAEALLKRRLVRMRRLDEDRYIDPELITHAEYQLFINERRAADEDRRPIHWDLDRFPNGQGPFV
jgi:predicted NACHT family NTPase